MTLLINRGLKGVLVFSCICFCISVSYAQSYQTAAGLRIGNVMGLTVQQRVAKYQTVEAIIQSHLFREEGNFSLLWERHYPLVTRGFNFYMGAGPQIGWYEVQKDLPMQTSGGVSVIGGAEMTLGKISLSFDIKPNIHLINGQRPINVESAISVRAVIVKKPSKEQKSGGLFKKKEVPSKNKKNGGLFGKKNKPVKI